MYIGYAAIHMELQLLDNSASLLLHHTTHHSFSFRSFSLTHWTVWMECKYMLIFSRCCFLNVFELNICVARAESFAYMWVMSWLWKSVYNRGNHSEMHVSARICKWKWTILPSNSGFSCVYAVAGVLACEQYSKGKKNIRAPMKLNVHAFPLHMCARIHTQNSERERANVRE